LGFLFSPPFSFPPHKVVVFSFFSAEIQPFSRTGRGPPPWEFRTSPGELFVPLLYQKRLFFFFCSVIAPFFPLGLFGIFFFSQNAYIAAWTPIGSSSTFFFLGTAVRPSLCGLLLLLLFPLPLGTGDFFPSRVVPSLPTNVFCMKKVFPVVLLADFGGFLSTKLGFNFFPKMATSDGWFLRLSFRELFKAPPCSGHEPPFSESEVLFFPVLLRLTPFFPPPNKDPPSSPVVFRNTQGPFFPFPPGGFDSPWAHIPLSAVRLNPFPFSSADSSFPLFLVVPPPFFFLARQRAREPLCEVGPPLIFFVSSPPVMPHRSFFPPRVPFEFPLPFVR